MCYNRNARETTLCWHNILVPISGYFPAFFRRRKHGIDHIYVQNLIGMQLNLYISRALWKVADTNYVVICETRTKYRLYFHAYSKRFVENSIHVIVIVIMFVNLHFAHEDGRVNAFFLGYLQIAIFDTSFHEMKFSPLS